MAETDSILDNQIVTAEILNDIAVDLGATSFNGFGENKFGADELNAITGDLVGAGILSCDDKCKPTIQEDKLYVGTGIIVFNNGVKKKITEPVEIDLIYNSYVYALNNTVNNTCSIITSQTAPIDGDYVNIAEIGADGTLTDKRTIAKAKVTLPTEGNSYYTTRTAVMDEDKANAGLLDDGTSQITLPIEGVSKIFFICDRHSRYEFDVATQTFSGWVKYDYDSDRHYIVSGQSYAHIRVQHIGSLDKYFTLTLVSSDDSSITFSTSIGTHSYIDDKTVTVEIYAFGGI